MKRIGNILKTHNLKKFYFLGLFLILYSCKFELEKGYGLLHSNSINESKRKGTYIKSYDEPKFVRINDSISLSIKEAFVEKAYLHSDTNENGRLKEFYFKDINHIVFTLNEDLRIKYKGFQDNWYFDQFWGGSGKHEKIKDSIFSCFCTYKNYYDTIQPPDSLEVKLIYFVRFQDSNKASQEKELGKFFLVRHNNDN